MKHYLHTTEEVFAEVVPEAEEVPVLTIGE